MSGIFGPTSTYAPLLLSHQTGLSVSTSTAQSWYAIGNAISVPRNGIVVISMSGHVSSSSYNGYIRLGITRGSASYYYGENNVITAGTSLFGHNGNSGNPNYITATSATPLWTSGNFNGSDTSGASPSFILPVFSGDSLQFYVSNSGSNTTTYIDDVLVMLI